MSAGAATFPLRMTTALLRVVGPGFVVMLADTDAASVLTAAQSGRDWGYRLLSLQLILIPVMYVAQELSVRVGLSTGSGFLEFIDRRYGRPIGIAVASVLVVSCFGALVSELCGLAGVGQLFGVSVPVMSFGAAAALLAVFVGHSHRAVERIALVFGAFEIVFVYAAWRSHPDPAAILADLRQAVGGGHGYLLLVAANIGTAVMPWTIAFQQSALVAKGLDARDLPAARLDTLIGAVVCQIVTAAILVASASSAITSGVETGVSESIPQMAHGFAPLLGRWAGPIVFAIALSGAALVAAIVVCLTAAWAACEVGGVGRSLDDSPRRAPLLYGILFLLLASGAGIVSSGMDLVELSIDVGAWNALLLPIVLGLLFLMARDASCGRHRLRGWSALGTGALLAATSGLGLFACLSAFAAP